MPNHGWKQSAQHKNALKVARWRWLFGPDWEAAFVKLYGEGWKDMTVKERKAIGYPKRDKNAYETPLESFLGKKEFCYLIAARLRDPAVPLDEFTALAQIFADVRGWVKAGYSVKYEAATHHTRRKAYVPEDEEKPEKQKLSEFDEQVRLAEASRQEK